ncbi:MAG: winged helix-turn-helix transcriptional regulator, partial [Candidatus Levybacteria bacterium]|nr:winged helix-turn-helix transcriptional regulator [Candidatus Levybacteria bacterium]
MLNDLFVSKVRVKMLQLFLANPGKIYHVREIVRRLDEEINAVRRELARMEKGGLVISEWRANRRYYEFRRDCLYYHELLEMVIKSTGIGGAIIKERNHLGKIKYAFMTLAFARGKSLNPSDIALMMVGNVVLPTLSAIVHDEEVRRETEINYSVMSEEEFDFRLSRRDPFILETLTKP